MNRLVWNRKLQRLLESIGFVPTHSDRCVYTNKETGVIIAMWVSDLMIFERKLADIEALKARLNEEYEMKNLGGTQILPRYPGSSRQGAEAHPHQPIRL